MTEHLEDDRDALLSAYDYALPEELIAQQPCVRGASRLLVLEKSGGSPRHALFENLPDLLPQGALLVANNSRVVPVRLVGLRPTGGKTELLLLSPLPLLEKTCVRHGERATVAAEVLLRPGRSARPGTVLFFGEEPDLLQVEVLEKGEFGRHNVKLSWSCGAEASGSLRAFFERYGRLPLPPYIRRPATDEDARNYQTIYAASDKAGSAAAPTAGLHFTPLMRNRLAEAGFEWTEVTLHVGYGTFSPVRCEDVRQHVMHREYIECPSAAAEAVARAKAEGRPVIAVGTTSCRTLEGTAAQCGGVVRPFMGWTDIFIRPGYVFHVVDGLITNFHLPRSTLVMLVSALTGRERLLAAYTEAVARRYRFFSYGDAMLIR